MPQISRVLASLAALLLSEPASAFRVRQKRRGLKTGSKPAATSVVAVTSAGKDHLPHWPEGTPEADGKKVITLGDSYSSGTGIHKSGKDYEGGDCWQDRKTTPGAMFAKADGLKVVNDACKGAEIPGIQQQLAHLAASSPADVASGWAGSTILFTIGGNDLRTAKGESWPSLLKSCIMSFYGKCHQKSENQIANFAELQATVTDLYTQVARDAPNAKIRILGYPRLMQRSWLCVPVPGLATSAADWADAQVDELNSRLSKAVATVKALSPGVDLEFVDVKNYYKRGACRTTRREIHAIVLSGLSISDASFHPSQRGYNKYYDALGSSLGRSLPPLPTPPEVKDPDNLMHVFQGWDKSGSGLIDMHEALAMAGEDATPDVTKRIRTIFMEADKDGDDALSLDEFETFMALVEDVEVRMDQATDSQQASLASTGGRVVTLGDSYSSGTGIHKSKNDYEGGDCWRDLKTTPGARFAAAEGLAFENMACNGDEVPQINQQWRLLRAKYPVESRSGWAGSTISFTIGGNDLQSHKGESWPSILKSCIMSFYGACHEDPQNQIANFAELQASLTSLYTQIAREAPNARIRVLGYPRLMMRSWHCIPVPGLKGSAANWADEQVNELNRRLNITVAAVRSSFPGVDIEYVDVKKYFKKGACSTTNREINAIVLSGLSISDASFHPSQRGYNLYYSALGSSLGRTLPPLASPPDERDPEGLKNIFQGWDTSQTGELSLQEVMAMAGEEASPDVTKQLQGFFREADKDQDGALSLEEFEALMELIGVDDLRNSEA